MQVSADVVIVGSGVCGALVAAHLATRGIKVLVLEAGPRIARPAALAQYRAALIKVPECPYPNAPYAPHATSDRPEGYYLQNGPAKFEAILPAAGGRHDLALARHDVLVRPGRFSTAIEFRGWRRLADFVRRPRALVLRGRAGAWRRGRSERGARRPTQPAVSTARHPDVISGSTRCSGRREAQLHRRAHSAGAQFTAASEPSRMLRQQLVYSDLPCPGEVRRHRACHAGGAGRRGADRTSDRDGRGGWRRRPCERPSLQAPGRKRKRGRRRRSMSLRRMASKPQSCCCSRARPSVREGWRTRAIRSAAT
jgi:NAD(P)-binding Rossmann-like domain